LKFDLSAEDYDRIFAAFFQATTQAVEQTRLLSIYLDTPEAVLREKDILWCFSRKDKVRDGRVKAGEWRLDRDRGGRSFIKKHRLFDRLGGVFTARIDRQQIEYRADEMAVEIGLERAKLRSGTEADIVSQIHFTTHDGETEELSRFISDVLPHSVPLPTGADYIERGYRLSGLPVSERFEAKTETDASTLSKTMRIADAFKLIVRNEIERALVEPLPTDGPSTQKNIRALRRVQNVFRFFRGAADADRDAAVFADCEAMLQKAYDLDMALMALKPAVQRGRWEMAPALLARIEESRTRAYAALAQSWPETRFEAMYSGVLEKLDGNPSPSFAGNERFLAFICEAAAKATDDIQALGQSLVRTLKHDDREAKTKETHRLSQSVTHLLDVIGFLEPLTKSKAARRRAELEDALADLKTLLDKDRHLRQAQALVEDAATHLSRLKQTKTQNAQIYAAGALAGYLEAMKAAEPEKALKKALASLSEVKPFWTKID
jgi:inorganic triphosphatase YgiF